MTETALLLGNSVMTPVANTSRREILLPGVRSEDFVVDVPCRIIKTGGRVSISASDLQGDMPGSYRWDSSSEKIRLINKTGPRLVVEALDEPSMKRDAEIITVTRRDQSNAESTKVIALTVARVVFSPSKHQNYGYDDYDTPNNHDDDHISVQSGDFTLVSVSIEGGALSSDFTFISDDTKICTLDKPEAASKFDLKIVASAAQKSKTILRIISACRSRETFASIALHVYSKKTVSVVVAKACDLRSPSTALRFAEANYAAFQETANESLKEAVVDFKLTNYPSSGSFLDIPFDPHGNGVVQFDINAGGGDALATIRERLKTNEKEDARVVVVRKIRSCYFLKNSVEQGDSAVTVVGEGIFLGAMQIGIADKQEDVEVMRNEGSTGFLSKPLRFSHHAGEVIEFPAAAWSSDPILLSEGDVSLEETKWTILHEVGHRELHLNDIKDDKNFMNWQQGNTANHLRFCPRVLAYQADATENQWELIPRPSIDESQK